MLNNMCSQININLLVDGYYSAAFVILCAFCDRLPESFINGSVPVCILYSLDLPDVFDLDGVHDLHIMPEVVQVVDRLILTRVAPSE